MEYEVELRNFILNDPSVLKIQSKLSLNYLDCKIKQCYNKNETLHTHEAYEQCKIDCISDLKSFNKFKFELNLEYNKFYYNKFCLCSKIESNDEFDECIKTNKASMKVDLEKIKSLIIDY